MKWFDIFGQIYENPWRWSNVNYMLIIRSSTCKMIFCNDCKRNIKKKKIISHFFSFYYNYYYFLIIKKKNSAIFEYNWNIFLSVSNVE